MLDKKYNYLTACKRPDKQRQNTITQTNKKHNKAQFAISIYYHIENL